jgi:hypothetical protein
MLILLAVLLYYFYSKNPSDKENLYVSCTFKNLTGLDCPGCGGQRAVHHLLHFEFGKAIQDNALFIFLIPYLALLFYYEIRRIYFGIPKPRNFFTSNKIIWIFLIALLVFGILRNLPFYPFNLLAAPD